VKRQGAKPADLNRQTQRLGKGSEDEWGLRRSPEMTGLKRMRTEASRNQETREGANEMTIHSNGIDHRARCGTTITAWLDLGRERKPSTDDWGQVTCKRCLRSYRNPDGSTSRQRSAASGIGWTAETLADYSSRGKAIQNRTSN